MTQTFVMNSCFALADYRIGDVGYELHFPSDLEDLKSLASLLKQYRQDNFGYVILLFCSAYLYKQTFAIPGSVFMNLLAGAIFGMWVGFPLVCTLTGCGATFCFLLSKAFGKVLLLQYFPDKIQALQGKVQENLDVIVEAEAVESSSEITQDYGLKESMVRCWRRDQVTILSGKLKMSAKHAEMDRFTPKCPKLDESDAIQFHMLSNWLFLFRSFVPSSQFCTAVMKTLTVTVSSSRPPPVTLLTVEHLKEKCPVTVEWGENTSLKISNDLILSSDHSIARYLARKYPALGLYGKDTLQASEGKVETLSQPGCSFEHITRWLTFCGAQPPFCNVSDKLPSQTQTDPSQLGTKMKSEGKYVNLPGASQGNVVTRFPPEASGYLHIGHAKAALLNQYYKNMYDGKMIMRFDDTNPAKENAEFEKVILEDLKMLKVKPDMFTHTSDHFDTIMTFAEKMIREGKAYADDTAADKMKEEREQRIKSANRDNFMNDHPRSDALPQSNRELCAVEKNLEIWEEMKKGTEYGQRFALRAKLDYQSENGCMRDPTIYRCKPEEHVRTGTKYKVYPTYDFACPIVDSIEGVTHALRTTEYHDRDPQYYWFIEQLGIRKPYIYEFSRLTLQNTVMSKRKLTYLVDQGYVEGWEDPRFPTVRGVLRRGMTVEGLREFIVLQGSSKANVHMEWDKIWALNKKVIDPIAPRYTALSKSDVVPVYIPEAQEEMKLCPLHPKNPSVGSKEVWYGPKVFIEGEDAAALSEGEMVTLMNWGNAKVTKINNRQELACETMYLDSPDFQLLLENHSVLIFWNPSGGVKSVEAELHLDNKDFKKTAKLTWIAESAKAPLLPTIAVEFDDVISKPILTKNDDFKNYINKDSKHETEIRYTGRENPCILFSVPDGHTKPSPTGGAKAKELVVSQKAETGGHKKSEKKSDSKKKDKGESVKPSAAMNGTDSPKPTASPEQVEKLKSKITTQGDKVRNLKSGGAPKEEVDAAVAELLRLKGEYKNLTGEDVAGGGRGKKEKKKESGKDNAKKDSKPVNKQEKTVTENGDADSGAKKITRLGLEAKKEENLSDWFSQVAWVTKSGQSELAEPIAIRPTSETVMYPAYAKWIKSHRDLPLKLNQWNNVVRWEFKHPQPFLRTREFLWQEGHSAFATYDEAVEEVYTILDLYRQVYTDLLAIPVIKGKKTEKEKFAGGDFTTTVEIYISASGRGIQGATSHHLGQNFSKMFDIVFEDPDPAKQDKRFVYQNSWGLTTRTVGVMTMVHGDNQGLVLPPRVASIQAVIVPCGLTVNLPEDEKTKLLDKCKQLEQRLKAAGVRAKGDYRDNYSPGWKFNHWELKGVPLRIEVGPRDLKSEQAVLVRRDTGEKRVIKQADIEKEIPETLERVHSDMYQRAKEDLDANLAVAHTWTEFNAMLDKQKIIQAPFCGDGSCEGRIKKDSARDQDLEPGAPSMGAKSLCIPFDQPMEITADTKCVYPGCPQAPKCYTLFGRSY
ncbi:hypothetical protein pdam_00011314 [Pocillopora damicornis]|uniref:Uncharacterized protein n=1 Tax=Pocillopora damicornis TaxID=46731 RepID=A0A3M6UGZ6_POCDA|nr:hypothetical protein pdam_00011314 [Pocillopora damicornis]